MENGDEEASVIQRSDSLMGQGNVDSLTAPNKANPEQANPEQASILTPTFVKTLAIDIGGSGVKVLVMDEEGVPLSERDRLKTPKPATPEAVVDVIEQLANRQEQDFDRVSVGFPGVVRQGVIYTAVNLHHTWVEYDLAQILETKLGKPTRVANDADIQGMGAITGQGVEMVITLGTGFGTALFVEGHLVPNLEFGHQRFRKGETYEEQLGRAALKKVGSKTWNQRLIKAIGALSHGFNFDRLYLGGGEVKHIKIDLPENVTVVPNVLGLIGGIKLWQ
ncbi:MAG: ROK family protein [Cyanobacteria bacterium P01_D01_bin.105]